jgi:hypothetical protein
MCVAMFTYKRCSVRLYLLLYVWRVHCKQCAYNKPDEYKQNTPQKRRKTKPKNPEHQKDEQNGPQHNPRVEPICLRMTSTILHIYIECVLYAIIRIHTHIHKIRRHSSYIQQEVKTNGASFILCWGPFCSSFWCSGFFGFVFLLFWGVFCLYSSGLLYTHCLQCLWINQSSLPLRISLMFI